MSNTETKSSKSGLIVLIVIVLIFAYLLSGDGEPDEPIVNSSDEKYTVMVYICGSDLESESGYASDDIEEMLSSQLASEINLLVYTGGTTEWSNKDISARKNQIFKVERNEDGESYLKLVDDTIGLKYMTEPEPLSYFLNYAKTNYPANKYGLILWDHGGGAVSGFGYDENDPDEDASLTLDEIKQALDSFEPKLEFVGFDACLMGGAEVAYAIKDNAKYMIASEESEPGSGWEYKKLCNQLSKDTSQSIEDFAKVVVDNYIKENEWLLGSDATLSVIDLNKMDDVYNNLLKFIKEIKESKFDYNKFIDVSKSLNNSKAFADGEMDTVDLIDFANNLKLSSTDSLVKSVQNAVVYNKVTDFVENSNGLSLYFPNTDFENYDSMVDIYRNIGFSDDYIDVLNEYVNVIAGGRKDNYYVNNHSYSYGYDDYSNYDWYDDEYYDDYYDYYNSTYIDTDTLEITDKGDYYALELSSEDWGKIVDVASSVWYDDGEGYIDLGIDSYYETDKDGNLKVEFDGYWIAIEGNVCSYTVTEKTDNYEKGKVPVYLNDEEANLIIYWDEKNPDGKVLGYEIENSYGHTTMQSRGYKKLKKGDIIEFKVDYYDYDGNYDDTYIWGDPLEVTNTDLKVSYEWAGDGECLIYYVLTDLYNNVYYTEAVIME